MDDLFLQLTHTHKMKDLENEALKRVCAFILLFSVLFYPAMAQDKCGTMTILEQKFKEQPSRKILFDQRELQFQNRVAEQLKSIKSLKTGGLVTIPVVIHVVMRQQSLATDAQLLAQIDTINKDYAGLNARANLIPDYFKSLFGQSGIQFKLAQRTPDDQPTTGIVRYSTSVTSFNYLSDDIKHASRGGADAWDPNRYLNVWVCALSNDILGYATFPNDGDANEQGVAISYLGLPGSSNKSFDGGKTLTHEIGHYFNLYHIWGDDNGACSGTDYIDDTPNQANSTNSVKSGVVTDACNTTSPGIMYQNFMDYTPDVCLLMFTKMQVARMEAAYVNLRSYLGSSNGATPIDLKVNGASLRSISSPDQRLCQNTFIPKIILRNDGSKTLTSATLTVDIDGGQPVVYQWTGSLGTYLQEEVSLPQLATSEGNHVLTAVVSNPNGVADEDTSNDKLQLNFIYYEPFAAPVTESFEGDFAPAGWDVVNEDGLTTWERTTVASKTGAASARIHNFEYTSVGQKDYLRSPTVNIVSVDSAFVSFQVAAATYSNATTANSQWDTLQVMISTDCGKTYTSVYKKWGSNLITRTAATRTAFAPAASEWRKEEINISQFISSGDVLVAFVNTTANENDIYLDDINIRTVTVNANLKEAGFLVTPNPTDKEVSVQFYPHPSELEAVYIYNSAGQKIAERVISGEVSTNVYDFDLSNSPAGLYIVKAVFKDRVLDKKFVKVR